MYTIVGEKGIRARRRFNSVQEVRCQIEHWYVHGCVGRAVSPRRRVIGASGNALSTCRRTHSANAQNRPGLEDVSLCIPYPKTH